jgi:S1-C subfamily serine protease
MEYEPPRLGIEPASDQVSQRLGIDEGVMILKVEPGSPAATGGLRPYRRHPSTRRWLLGDIIVAIDGKPVKSARDVFTLMDGRRFGDIVTVTIDRDGERIDVSVTLEPRGRGPS